MAEIQARIEARGTAKDLTVAHATLEDLRDSNPDPLLTAANRGKRSEREKKTDEKPRVNKREAKKVPAARAMVEVPVTAKVAKRNSKNANKEKSGEEEVAPLRVSKRVTVSRREDDALATLKFSSSAEKLLQGPNAIVDALSTSLGIALVASALGRKVPSVRVCDDSIGMSKCHVKLSAVYKDSNLTAFITPPTSNFPMIVVCWRYSRQQNFMRRSAPMS